MSYTKEDLETDIDWLTGGYITESEARKFILFLLNIPKDNIEVV